MAQKKESFIRTKILSLFFISTLSMLIFLTFSNIKLVYFALFIIFLFYHLSFISILWIAMLLGFFQDLLSSSFFGINACLYLISVMVLFKEKKYFNDKPISLSIFTAIFSLIFSLFSPILFFIFDKKINLSIKWIITDIIVYPILDGIYAFVFFAMPILFFEYVRKIGYKSLWMNFKMIFQRSR